MPRTSRMLVTDEKAVYHVMSRTALDGFPLGDVEKEFLLGLIKRFSGLYFTEILGFCLMGNHFHLLVKMLPDDRYSDRDIMARLERFYGSDRFFGDGQIPHCGVKSCPVFPSLCVKSRLALPAIIIGAITGGAIFGETGLKVLLWKRAIPWLTAWPTLT